MSDKKRIFLVDGKAVAIIKSYTHTYHVRFIKSGKFLEVKKDYVISYFPDKHKKRKKPKPNKSKPTNSQTKLNL